MCTCHVCVFDSLTAGFAMAVTMWCMEQAANAAGNVWTAARVCADADNMGRSGPEVSRATPVLEDLRVFEAALIHV